MKDFHAEPIKRDLDRNQTLSCPGSPCLESVIHLLTQVCSRWFSTEGDCREGKREGQELEPSHFQHHSQVRQRKRGCDSFLDLTFLAKRNQRGRFLKTDELVEDVRTMAERQGPQGLNKTVPLLPFNKTE